MSSPRRDRVIGPSLRPDDVVPASGIGPAIPVEIFRSKLEKDATTCEPDDIVNLSTIGPLIPGQELGEELRHLRPDGDDGTRRCDTSGIPTTGRKRDLWMTHLLPASGANTVAALKPRKFQQTVSGSGDVGCDSSWFKTPGAGSNSPENDAEAACEKQSRVTDCMKRGEAAYNAQMSRLKDQCQDGTNRTSLLELHRKKIDKKSKKKDKKDKKEEKKKKHKHEKTHKKRRHRSSSPEPSEPSRRPFDRDKDLKISRIDSAARHALIERSKQLSSRFGHGSRQFL